MGPEEEEHWWKEPKKYLTKGEIIVFIIIAVIAIMSVAAMITSRLNHAEKTKRCDVMCHPYQSLVQAIDCFCATKDDWKFKGNLK